MKSPKTYPDPHGRGYWIQYDDGNFYWVKGDHFGCIYFNELTPERMELLADLKINQETPK